MMKIITAKKHVVCLLCQLDHGEVGQYSTGTIGEVVFVSCWCGGNYAVLEYWAGKFVIAWKETYPFGFKRRRDEYEMLCNRAKEIDSINNAIMPQVAAEFIKASISSEEVL